MTSMVRKTKTTTIEEKSNIPIKRLRRTQSSSRDDAESVASMATWVRIVAIKEMVTKEVTNKVAIRESIPRIRKGSQENVSIVTNLDTSSKIARSALRIKRKRTTKEIEHRKRMKLLSVPSRNAPSWRNGDRHQGTH